MENPNIHSFLTGLSAKLNSLREIRKLYNPQMAFEFNSLNFFRPGENKVSEILAFFLDPQEAHGQGDVFLRKFVEFSSCEDEDKKKIIGLIESEKFRIKCEERTDFNRRVDIVIYLGEKFAIGIENKIGAGDQENQVIDYIEFLEGKYKNEHILFYLTKTGNDPSEGSIPKEIRQKKKVLNLSYKDNIIKCVGEWAKLCQAERVRSFLLDFEQYLKQIINNERYIGEQKMSIDHILQSPENVEAAFQVASAVDEVKKQLVARFFDYFAQNLISTDFQAECNDTQFHKHERYFYLKNPNWRFVDIYFGFVTPNYSGFSYGLMWKGNQEDISSEQKLLSDKLAHIKKSQKADTQLAWWQYWDDHTNWSAEEFISIAKSELQNELKKVIEDLLETFKEVDL